MGRARVEKEGTSQKTRVCPISPFRPGQGGSLTVGNPGPCIPAGLAVLAVLEVLIGVRFCIYGFGGLLDSIFAPPQYFHVVRFFPSFLIFGAGMIMVLLGRGLGRLQWWTLWGTIAMDAVMIMVAALNPFAGFFEMADPFARMILVAMGLVIVFYLGRPYMRHQFSAPKD